MSLLPIWASRKWGDNAVLIFGLVWMVCASLVKMNYTWEKKQNREQYYAGSILFFCGFLITEMASISILAKVIPPRLKTSYWNAGLFSGTADTFGRGIGSFLFTAYTVKSLQQEMTTAYIVSVVGSFLLLIIAFFLYRRLVTHTEVYLGKDARAISRKRAASGFPGPSRLALQ